MKQKQKIKWFQQRKSTDHLHHKIVENLIKFFNSFVIYIYYSDYSLYRYSPGDVVQLYSTKRRDKPV